MKLPNILDLSQPVLLTSEQTRAMLNVSARTLFTLAESGQIPRVYIGRAVRFDIADVHKFIADQKTTGTSK